MKNHFNLNRNWKFAAAFGLATAVMGCGQSAAPGLVAPPTPIGQVPQATTSGCPAGQVRIAGGPCVAASDFNQACMYSGGQVTQVTGVNVCRVERSFNPFNSAGFPILTPSSPQGPYANYQFPVTVKTGDRLSLNGSVSWGPVASSSDTFLGIFHVTTWSINCDDISSTGMKGSTQLTNEGLPAGFVVSDGQKVYTLPATMEHDGDLRTGFNASASLANGGACYKVNVATTGYGLGYSIGTGVLKLLHCEDSTGKTYPCP